MLSPATLFLSLQFLKFLLAGVAAAVVNFISRIILTNLGVEFGNAVLVAYLMGMLTAFLLFRLVVFRGTATGLMLSIVNFTLVNVLGLFIAYGVSNLLYYRILPSLGLTWHSAEIAHLIGISIPAFSSFIGHKYLTFRMARATKD